jgi:hypothetical protein
MTVDCNPPGLAVIVNEVIGAVISESHDSTVSNDINEDPDPTATTEEIVGVYGVFRTKSFSEGSESCEAPAVFVAVTANL